MSSLSIHDRDYLLLFCLSLLLLLGKSSIDAADTFDSGRNISDGDVLVSAGGSFTMGFFSLGEPRRTRRYLGIWFSVSEDAVCWVANRDRPINGSTGVLSLGDAGRLLLLDGGGQVAWSSNAAGAVASSVAQLLDSGNLVVRDRASSRLLWQSFDPPSNTLLPGMKTGKNLWTDVVELAHRPLSGAVQARHGDRCVAGARGVA